MCCRFLYFYLLYVNLIVGSQFCQLNFSRSRVSSCQLCPWSLANVSYVFINGNSTIMPEEELFLDSTQAGQCRGDTGDHRSRSRLGLLVTGVLGGSLVALYAVVAPFVAPALRKVCLPFVPATTAQVENVLKVLQARTGTLVDIGSGDGRIVIAAAKRGFQASGFELNPWLVWFSRYKAWREGVHHSTSFRISDLWKVSFAQYSNVVIFGVPQMMDQLELKLARELPGTAKVVACRFPFPTWVPEHTAGEGIDTVWVYDAGTFKSHLQQGTEKRQLQSKKTH